MDCDDTNIQPTTYLCNTDFETLKRKVLDSSFLSLLQFFIVREDENVTILKSVSRSSRTVVIAITGNKNETGCMLSFVVYRRNFDKLFALENDKEVTDRLYEVINDELFKVNPEYGLVKDKSGLHQPVALLAKNYALYQTKSVFGMAKEPIIGVWRASHYYLIVIAVTLVLLGGFIWASIVGFGGVDQSTYVNIIIFLVFVLITEIGIPLRDEVNKRSKNA